MYVVCVQVKVKPEFIDEFIRATQENHEGTRKMEAANVRWDLLQAEDDPTKFFIYEVYRTKEDFPKHQQTEHYLKWKAAVADWMAEPRVGTRYTNLYPVDNNWNE
jgi:autoinducer 2-degrading protein